MGNIRRAMWGAVERASEGFINWLLGNREMSSHVETDLYSDAPFISLRKCRRSFVKGLLRLRWVPVVNRGWRGEMIWIAHSLCAMAQAHSHPAEELLAILADKAASQDRISFALGVLWRKGVRVDPSILRALLAEGKCPYMVGRLLVEQTGKEDADLLFVQWEKGRFGDVRGVNVFSLLFRADPQRAEAVAREEIVRGSDYAFSAATFLWPLGHPDDERLIRQHLERTSDPTEKRFLESILSSPRNVSQRGA